MSEIASAIKQPLPKDRFIYSLILGVSVESFFDSISTANQDAFPVFINAGNQASSLYNLSNSMSESVSFWNSIFQSKFKLAYYSIALCPLYPSPLFFAFWSQSACFKKSYLAQACVAEEKIHNQLSQILAFPWRSVLQGSDDAVSKVDALEIREIPVFSFAKPSALIRRWPVMALAIATGICTVKFAIGADLEWWLGLAREWKLAMYAFGKQWIVEPLGEIWSTIRYKSGRFGIGSSLAADAESLKRMVNEYVTEKRYLLEDEGEALGLVYRDYEKRVVSPLRHPVDLIRLGLIQAQKTRVDASAALEALDQLLRANELNFALLAALPSLLILAGVGKWLFYALFSSSNQPTREVVYHTREMKRSLRKIQNILGRNEPNSRSSLFLSILAFYFSSSVVFEESGYKKWIEEDLLFIFDESIDLSARMLAADRLWRYF